MKLLVYNQYKTAVAKEYSDSQSDIIMQIVGFAV